MFIPSSSSSFSFFFSLILIIKISNREFINDIQLNREKSFVNECLRGHNNECFLNCDEENYSIQLLNEICKSYCKVDVSWSCYQQNLQENEGVYNRWKFYGRWPFSRVGIFSEFGSCLFSLFSAFFQWYLIIKYDKTIQQNTPKLKKKSNDNHHYNHNHNSHHSSPSYPYEGLWKVSVWSWVITFFCAFLFHTVDIPITKYLDYYSAMMSILFHLFLSLVRVFAIQKKGRRILLTSFAIFFILHVYRMTFVHFAYGYNMKISIFFLVCASIVWAKFILQNMKTKKYCVWMLMGQVVFYIFAAAFEVFDFPPYFGYFDSHACWHLCMSVVSYLWARFYRNDALHHLQLPLSPSLFTPSNNYEMYLS